MQELKDFFNGKTVLLTGHTGFKGGWLSIWLNSLGAKVIGYALEPYYKNSIFELARMSEKIADIRGDILDFEKLNAVFEKYKPDIVIHLAAQALVRLSYDKPKYTFETNVIGTINILECVRKHSTKSAVLITSDKCYKNIEHERGYIETDAMSDQDPYSCSKGCIEMVVESYRKSFGMKVATARAGNVIGGGDWAADRLVPDIIKAIESNNKVIIRSPDAVRPWQFVLEPLYGYLLLAKKQYGGENLSSGWNFGPDRNSMVKVEQVVRSLLAKWGSGEMEIQRDSSSKHEAKLLYLDCTKSKNDLEWHTRLGIDGVLDYIVEWYKNYKSSNVYDLCLSQIRKFEAEKSIPGLNIVPLKIFSDERGKLMHMLKITDPYFKNFGEIYFSTVYPGKIKGWHRSNKTTKNYVAVKGNIKLVLFDGKNVKEIEMGEKNYCLVTIPPGVWSSFTAIGEEAIIADLTDLPHNPEDSEKAEPYSLTDYWKVSRQ